MFGLCKQSRASSQSTAVAVIPNRLLYVSEPDPRMFGNPANSRNGSAEGWNNQNWLKSRFHFSFAEYSGGPSSFGVLRVMNDDLVQPERGFGAHPHRDMEILTFIVSGELTHQDSMGTKETLGRGSLQFMTAGTGIRHSEHNLKKGTPLRFIQSWVIPRRRGLTPNYGSLAAGASEEKARRDQWMHVVSDVEGEIKAPVQINQDCNVFVTELSPESASPPLLIAEGRQAYMLCVEGDFKIADQGSLRQHDAAELRGPVSLELMAGSNGAMALVFEMAKTSDGRRDIPAPKQN